MIPHLQFPDNEPIARVFGPVCHDITSGADKVAVLHCLRSQKSQKDISRDCSIGGAGIDDEWDRHLPVNAHWHHVGAVIVLKAYGFGCNRTSHDYCKQE